MKQIKKELLIVLLLVFPTTLLLGTFIKPVSAARNSAIPDDPDIDPKNDWNWGVDLNDTLMFEISLEMVNLTSLEVQKNRYLQCMNISAMYNNTGEILGKQGGISHINATNKYWDFGTGEWNEYSDPFEINSAHYNGTDSALYLLFGDGFNFWVLPKNGTTFNSAEINPSLNYTLAYYAYFQQINWMTQSLPKDNGDEHELNYWNSTEGYYMNFTYYNNGTLKSADAHFKLNLADQAGVDWVNMTMTIERVFDWNVTNGVEWGVGVGDKLYFGDNNFRDDGPVSEQYQEMQFEITKINSSYYDWEVMGDEQLLLFQNIYANLSRWNSSAEIYDFVLEDVLIGCANNLIAVNIQKFMGVQDRYFLLVPKGTTKEDFEWIFYNNSRLLYEWGINSIYLTNDGLLQSDDLSYNPRSTKFDLSDGILEWMYEVNSTHRLSCMFRKNVTVLSSGSGTFDLWSDIVTEWDVTVDYTSGNDTDLYWAMQKENIAFDCFVENAPWALPEEYQIYIDIYTNSSSDFSYPVNVTFQYSNALEAAVNESLIKPYYFDSGNKQWVFVPYEYCTRDLDTNQITINFAEVSWGSLLTFGLSSEANVSWSVNTGDVIYYGVDAQSGISTNRMTIVGFNNSIIDMDALGMGLNGGPQNQSFSNIIANVSEWDNVNEQWGEGAVKVVCSANNYWPIAPHLMQGDYLPPVIVPIGTNGTEIVNSLQYLNFFDSKIFGDDWFYLYNSTAKVPSFGNWSITTGVVSVMGGGYYTGSNWAWYTFYTYEKAEISSGSLIDYSLTSEFANDWQLKLNASFSNDQLLLWKVLDFNPHMTRQLVNDLPENVSIYFDLFLNDTSAINSVNLTVDYNSALTKLGQGGIAEEDLQPYWYDPEDETWYLVNFDMYDLNKVDDELYSYLSSTGLYSIGTGMTGNIDWSVTNGDVLYYGEEHLEFTKMVIYEINQTDNLVDLQAEGIDFTGMPQNQTFIMVWANISYWNNTARSWINLGIDLIAAANNYFPLAPMNLTLHLGGNPGAPVLLPTGYNGDDLTDALLDLMDQYDTVDVSEDEYIKISVAADPSKTTSMYFDNETGIIEHIYGWYYNVGVWEYFTHWSLNHTNYGVGQYLYENEGLELDVVNINTNLTITSGNMDIFYSIFTYEPSSLSITRGTPILYISSLVINNTNIEGTSQMIIELPSSIDLSSVIIDLWSYELNDIQNSDDDTWTRMLDAEKAQMIKINATEHTITITFSLNDGSSGSLLAISYYEGEEEEEEEEDDGDDDSSEEVAIPFGNFYILFLILSVISLVLIKRKTITHKSI